MINCTVSGVLTAAASKPVAPEAPPTESSVLRFRDCPQAAFPLLSHSNLVIKFGAFFFLIISPVQTPAPSGPGPYHLLPRFHNYLLTALPAVCAASLRAGIRFLPEQDFRNASMVISYLLSGLQ